MIQSGITPNNISTIINKTWLLADQKVAFSGAFTPSLNSVASFVDPIVSPLGYNHNSIKPGLMVSGNDLTNLILNQSLEYFQKALYNFNSHYILANRGFRTWASVTNYYSSYFSVFALLSLQGRVITRLKLDGVNDTTCIIHPTDFKGHEYIITSKEVFGGASHQAPWRKYYTLYNGYAAIKPEFDVIQLKSFVGDTIAETEDRNKVNYKIFEGFQEVLSLVDINDFKNQYLHSLSNPILGKSLDEYLQVLRALATDADFKYFARSALRLILIKLLFEEIGLVNPTFKTEFNRRLPIWQESLYDYYNAPINYYENFVQTFLN